jgi:tetratricopeptide (TPR) repeat protein
MRQIFLLSFFGLIISCNEKDKLIEPIDNKSAASQEASLKAAVSKNPDSILLVQNLVEYYADGQNYDAALATVDNALKRDIANPFLWDMKAIVAGQKGDTAQAISALEKAIQILPNPSFIVSLGALYAETSNPKALELSDALLIGSKAKAEKEALFIKGLYFSFKNEKEKAIPFFEKCIALDYNFMQGYLEKALALYDLKKYAAAAEVLETSVTVQNQFDKGYYYLGQCYEKLNRTQEAIEAYQLALQLDPSYVEAKDALGKLGVRY